MNMLLILLLALQYVSSKQFVELTYQQILDKWGAYRRSTPTLLERDAAEGIEDPTFPANNCKGPCQYLLYEYTSPEYDPAVDITVLIISGFHGDQRLGPTIVTESFAYLSGRHMLFMPIINPSGFISNCTFEFPSRVDPLKDFTYAATPH